VGFSGEPTFQASLKLEDLDKPAPQPAQKQKDGNHIPGYSPKTPSARRRFSAKFEELSAYAKTETSWQNLTRMTL
jgi:hypothetical protein